MDHNSIIDRKTFEVCKDAEDHKDVFICDKEIWTDIYPIETLGEYYIKKILF